VGFDESTIIGGSNAQSAVYDPSSVPLFYILSGSITVITPTPEPSSFALTLLGLKGFLVMHKRMGARNRWSIKPARSC
jgi:hypothetical protein